MPQNIVYFGIPLISQKAAKNWQVVTRLFNNTLASVYNQSSQNFRVLVACHDIPAIAPRYATKTEFIPVNAPIPTNSEEKMQDKAIKKLALGNRLQELGGGYFMFLDADDLVHRHLVDYVLNHQHPHGYVLKQGYELNVSRQKIRPLRSLNMLCGSCAIINFQPEDLPGADGDGGLDSYFAKFKAHCTWEFVAEHHNRPLAEIPFEAAVYVRNTGQNHSSFVPNWRHRLRPRQQFLALLGNRSISPELCADFCIQGI